MKVIGHLGPQTLDEGRSVVKLDFALVVTRVAFVGPPENSKHFVTTGVKVCGGPLQSNARVRNTFDGSYNRRIDIAARVSVFRANRLDGHFVVDGFLDFVYAGVEGLSETGGGHASEFARIGHLSEIQGEQPALVGNLHSAARPGEHQVSVLFPHSFGIDT